MLDAQLPGKWKLYTTSITITDAARAKILVEESQPAVLAAISGETALPGETTVRQRVLSGGQRVFDGSFSSTDAVAKSLLIWTGPVLSKQANMGAPTITVTNVLNRTAGSFLTDGWDVTDSIMLFDALTAANNGVVAQITAVTATAITVNGTPWTNETPTAIRAVRIAQVTRRAVPANSGNTDAIAPVQLLGGAQDPSRFSPPDTGISLDQDSILAISAVAALSALPARIDGYASAALY